MPGAILRAVAAALLGCSEAEQSGAPPVTPQGEGEALEHGRGDNGMDTFAPVAQVESPSGVVQILEACPEIASDRWLEWPIHRQFVELGSSILVGGQPTEHLSLWWMLADSPLERTSSVLAPQSSAPFLFAWAIGDYELILEAATDDGLYRDTLSCPFSILPQSDLEVELSWEQDLTTAYELHVVAFGGGYLEGGLELSQRCGTDVDWGRDKEHPRGADLQPANAMYTVETAFVPALEATTYDIYVSPTGVVPTSSPARLRLYMRGALIAEELASPDEGQVWQVGRLDGGSGAWEVGGDMFSSTRESCW